MNQYMLALACLALVASCAPVSDVHQVSLNVSVTEDDRIPLMGAELTLNGKPLGVTNSHGRKTTLVEGREGEIITVGVDCPDGYQIQGENERRIPLRLIRKLDDNSGHTLPIETRFICSPTVRDHVLVVRTDGRDGLPVTLMGQVAVHTDNEGVAQFSLRGSPGDEVQVTIDTSEEPALRPSMPTRRLLLPDRSRFIVFEQRFEERKPKKKKRKKKRRQGGPRRI